MNEADAIKEGTRCQTPPPGITRRSSRLRLLPDRGRPQERLSWWTLSVDEKREWMGKTPLAFVAPVVEIKPGEIVGCHHCGRPFPEVAA